MFNIGSPHHLIGVAISIPLERSPDALGFDPRLRILKPVFEPIPLGAHACRPSLLAKDCS